MHTVDTIMPETAKLRLNRLKKSISVPNHFSHTFLEIQKWAFWGFLRLSMPKHRHTWIDQSFVLADLSIFYERSL